MCTSISFTSPAYCYLANNEDISISVGSLFTNQRGLKKTALLMPPARPLQWHSILGSVTFNQAGKEFPSGGMNEAGLVVEQTTLRETQYPEPDANPGIKELQLIQYLLDTCETVSRALECISAVRITQPAALIQYMLLDREGDAAILEFVNGRAQVFSGDSLPLPVITNSLYRDTIANFESGGTHLPLWFDNYAQNSLERFCIAAAQYNRVIKEGKLEPEMIFDILDLVQRPDTLWKIIYDPRAGKILLKTRQHPEVKWLNLRDLDFLVSFPPMTLDLTHPASGNLRPHFVEYSTPLNRQLILDFFGHPLTRNALGVELPAELLEILAAYPQTMQPEF